MSENVWLSMFGVKKYGSSDSLYDAETVFCLSDGKNHYFSHILREGLCFFRNYNPHCFANLRATNLSRFPGKPLNGVTSAELLVAS